MLYYLTPIVFDEYWTVSARSPQRSAFQSMLFERFRRQTFCIENVARAHSQLLRVV